MGEPGVDRQGAAFAVGGAADVTLAFDTARALVDSGEYPFLIALGRPQEYGQSILDKLKADPTGTIATFVGRTLFIQGQFLNSWTRATGKNPKGGVSVAGAVNFEDFAITSQAIIGDGASINQNAALKTDAQTVSVDARTAIKRVDLAGIFDIELSPDGLAKMRHKGEWAALYEPFGTQGTVGGLGGAFNYLSYYLAYEITTEARIGDRAKVSTGAEGAFSVGASEDILAVTLMQSGAEGGKFAVAGAVSYVTGDTHTTASVGSGVTITAPSLTIDAAGQSFLFGLAGSVFKGDSIGFGVAKP